MREIVKPVLSARGLTKYYPGVSAVYAVRDANVFIYPGDFVVVLGPSGSGKSTLLALLGGLERPSGGRIQLGDVIYHHLYEAELTELRQMKIGFVFQYFNLLNSLTALNNVALSLRLFPLTEDEIRERSLAMLEEVGLKDRAHHLPSQLSGGEQQRVALARAIVHRPEILLADEPTGNLDGKNAAMIKQLLVKMNTEFKQTIVVVSHDASFRQLANRVVYMEDGKIARIEVKDRGAN
ncbi:MAG: ABC transporter ATP-binding protein [Firmicutes bacterium]|nr:ABC transporter ATP-binding protein [Bacillota bacterium]